MDLRRARLRLCGWCGSPSSRLAAWPLSWLSPFLRSMVFGDYLIPDHFLWKVIFGWRSLPITNLQGSLFWSGLCHPLSSGDLKTSYVKSTCPDFKWHFQLLMVVHFPDHCNTYGSLFAYCLGKDMLQPWFHSSFFTLFCVKGCWGSLGN